jgi:hypothetical protein
MSGTVTETAASSLPYTRALQKPVAVLTQTVTSITLREPTGADLASAGTPALIGVRGLEIDAPRMNALIGRLAGIPDTAVATMDARDVYACSLRIAGFLLSGGEETPS